jgi:secreted Zn-dependent insulinase-like peptidase
VQASSKACFYDLRTVRRLGYAVSLYSASYGGGGRPAHAAAAVVVDAAAAGAAVVPASAPGPEADGDNNGNDNNGDNDDDPLRPRAIKHLCIRVQSPATEPERLAAAAKEWLSSFRAELEGMPDADLDAHRAALCSRYLEPARSLADAAARCWRPVRSSRRDWRWRERKAAAAGALGRADLLAFYDAHLDPARSAAMVVMVKGGGGGKKAEGERAGEEAAAAASRALRPPPLVGAFFFGA